MKAAPPPKRGPGRPRLPDCEKQVKCTVRLYPAEIDRLTKKYGSVHAAIRQIVERDLDK